MESSENRKENHFRICFNAVLEREISGKINFPSIFSEYIVWFGVVQNFVVSLGVVIYRALAL